MVNTQHIEQGLARWLDIELMPQLPQDGWKKVVAGAAMAIVLKRSEQMLQNLAHSPFMTALEISTEDGEIDIDIIAQEIKANTPDKGFIIDLPLIGSMTIKRQDIENLHSMIKEAQNGYH